MSAVGYVFLRKKSWALCKKRIIPFLFCALVNPCFIHLRLVDLGEAALTTLRKKVRLRLLVFQGDAGLSVGLCASVRIQIIIGSVARDVDWFW